MKYRPRPGIVLTKICNANVLIPTRAVWQECNTIIRLTMLWAATWELLGREDSDAKILRVHQILTKKSDEEIQSRLDAFYAEMYKKGFLIKETMESENDEK